MAILAAVLWLARLALKRWVDGPDPRPSPEPWPTVRESKSTTSTAPTASTANPTTPASTATKVAPVGGPVWVEANGTNDAPPSHPVKAKMSSKVYREPGMAGYAQSKPDRCYASAEAAETDGFTRAKR